jgi:Domain of unknown function (DUF4160)
MPTIASFRGVSIKLYPNDHQPADFHAFHGDDEAMIGITEICVIEGRIPGARLKEVLAWAHRHREELLNRTVLPFLSSVSFYRSPRSIYHDRPHGIQCRIFLLLEQHFRIDLVLAYPNRSPLL